jgi:hypothetical protein
LIFSEWAEASLRLSFSLVRFFWKGKRNEQFNEKEKLVFYELDGINQ